MYYYVERQSQNIIVCSMIVLLHSEIIDFWLTCLRIIEVLSLLCNPFEQIQ